VIASRRFLVVGFRVMGAALAQALLRRGLEVIAVDDHPSTESRVTAELLGVTLIESPPRDQLSALVADVDAVLPSPGIPDRHPVFALAEASDRPVLSEYDLARTWDDRPLIAITGTDGKTTVTTLVRDMLVESGRRAVACGNNELPLVSALERDEPEVFVVEASSFQLGHTQRIEPKVATWLNFAPDHLDVHRSLDAYENAKAKLWSTLPEDAVAVANADDPVVMRHLPTDRRAVIFGHEGQFRIEDASLVGPGGEPIIAVAALPRSLPHDLDNALAAAATATAHGAPIESVATVLGRFRGLPHRVELVGEWDGVAWYDDSKATVPHATVAALHGFEQAVLIAGGRNKGLDLTPLADLRSRLRAVVAIGEAAVEVASVFTGHCPVHVIDSSIDDAVAVAAALAHRGDAVVLSPGCASFDWFDSYHARGEAFQAAVRRRFDDTTGEVVP
jgi:UDP-N-acetylmuramoylalanine--D-glutamate ligase